MSLKGLTGQSSNQAIVGWINLKKVQTQAVDLQRARKGIQKERGAAHKQRAHSQKEIVAAVAVCPATPTGLEAACRQSRLRCEEESGACRAIRTYMQRGETSKRIAETFPDQPSSKIIKATGDSNGEVGKEATSSRPCINEWGKDG